jgi:hypothetical protein
MTFWTAPFQLQGFKSPEDLNISKNKRNKKHTSQKQRGHELGFISALTRLYLVCKPLTGYYQSLKTVRLRT